MSEYAPGELEEPECENNVPMQVESPLPVDVDGALEWWNAYQRLTDELLDESDYQDTPQGKFKKKSAWRKYGTAFNISIEVVNREIIRDDQGRVVTAEVEVMARTKTGREMPGWGSCSIHDKAHELDKVNDKGRVTCEGPCDGRKHFSHPEHDIPSTAHTRAVNRAIADMIGAGEVSAEEMDLATQKSKKGNGKTGKVKARQRPGTNLKQEMKSKKPEDTPPEGIDPDNVQDAEVTPKTDETPETHDMSGVDLKAITGINDELDIWIHTVEDVGATKKEVLKQCQDMLGKDLEMDEFKQVKKALGMKVK